jgi:hypothetical protein
LPTKSKAELQAENRALRRGNIAISATSVINNLTRCGMVVLIARYMYLSTEVLAGRTTSASIVMTFLASVTVSKALAYILGTSGIVYGVGERKLRQRTVKRLQSRITKLEAAKDPKRTSSKLTPKGETRPQDRE